MDNFNNLYHNKAETINQYLNGLFPEISDVPEPLYGAMKYSLLNGGKRLRPVLMMSAAELFPANVNEVMAMAAALEMIHTYSLIHDDLPCMDDDSLRRDRPTSHMIYGEGIAVLAGDALLNQAYELILESAVNAEDIRRYMKAANIIARAAGTRGMVAGQCMDLNSEANDSVTEKDLMEMHRYKTSKMIEAAVLVGAVLGGADEDETKSLLSYGENLGLSFQIRDDILDVLGDGKQLGKPIGSDIDKDKLTFPKLYGVEKSKQLLAEYTQKAVDALKIFDDRADFLRTLALNLEQRNV